MNKIKKNLLSFVFLMVLMLPVFGIAQVANAGIDWGNSYVSNTGLEDDGDPRDIVINILNVMMTFLGIIAVIIMLLGGFKWMTAAGNEDKVSEAKKLIVAGIMGLIIILSAFLLVTWVINTVETEVL